MKRSLRAYLAAVEPFRARAVSVVILAALAPLIESIALLFLIPLINSLSGESALSSNAIVSIVISAIEAVGLEPTRLVLLIIFVGLALISAVLSYIGDRQAVHLVTEVQARMQSTFFSAVVHMDWATFTSMRPGDLVKANDGDVRFSTTGLTQAINAMSGLISVLIYLGLAFAISWQFTLMVVGIGALAIYPVIRYVRRGRRVATRARRAHEKMSHELTGLLSSAKSIFSTGLRDFSSTYYEGVVDNFRDARYLQQLQPHRLRFSAQFAGILIVFFVFVLLIDSGTVSLGSALVWIGAFIRLSPRIAEVQRATMTATSYSAWLERWQQLYRVATDAAARAGGIPSPELHDQMVFDGVSFGFPERDLTLQEVDMTINAGECVAVTGPSGAGKTTIFDLMTGLLTPTSGQIRIDDVPLVRVDIEKWQSQIGAVLQGSLLLNASVKQNIALGDADEVDDDRLIDACRRAHALEFIEELPKGFGTPIGHLGSTLSGGQAQRISIARALYRRPSLLLLDEPTSNLDPATKALIRDTIIKLRGSMTIVIVSHDDDLPQIADRVFRLADKQLVEVDEGTLAVGQ